MNLELLQYRSPEEDQDMALNEKIDVYSLGNNFYSILTGLWIHYDVQDDTVVQVSSFVVKCWSSFISAVISLAWVRSHLLPFALVSSYLCHLFITLEKGCKLPEAVH